MNRLIAFTLLCSAIAAHADSIRVNVPLTVKSMRSEISHVRVNCTLWYYDENGEQKLRSSISGAMALDSFGNLQRNLSLVIPTEGISPDQVHAPDSLIQCAARLHEDASQDSLLITHGFTSPRVNQANLLIEEETNLLVVKRNWVPDPAPRFEILSGNNSSAELKMPAANQLRIR